MQQKMVGLCWSALLLKNKAFSLLKTQKSIRFMKTTGNRMTLTISEMGLVRRSGLVVWFITLRRDRIWSE
jgi:hypothetical protein